MVSVSELRHHQGFGQGVLAARQPRDLSQLDGCAWIAGEEQRLCQRLGKISARCLQGRDRSQLAHTRTGRISVARSSRLSRTRNRVRWFARRALETEVVRQRG